MLDIDLGTIIWEILNFLVLMVILYFLVFKPMTKRAEERAIEKAALRAALQRDQLDAQQRLAELDERLVNLDVEIEKIMDQAYLNSQVQRNDLLEATRVEAESLMMQAVSEARREQEVDIKRLQSNLVETVIKICNDTLREVAPTQVNDQLIEEMNRNIWNFGRTDMRMVQNIRESLEERIPTVKVEVARELTTEQRVKLINTFNALADKEVELDVHVRPELVSGIRARVGDIVLDNTIYAQLDSMREEISQKLETLAKPEDE
ncbi:MAG: F0F1 ATP synthase subunit delta [Anaerolineaceae bacterium]